MHQQPLIDITGLGFPVVDPLGFSLDNHLGDVASLQPPPPPMLFHESINTKLPLLGAQPLGLLNQYQHQQPPLVEQEEVVEVARLELAAPVGGGRERPLEEQL